MSGYWTPTDPPAYRRHPGQPPGKHGHMHVRPMLAWLAAAVALALRFAGDRIQPHVGWLSSPLAQLLLIVFGLALLAPRLDFAWMWDLDRIGEKADSPSAGLEACASGGEALADGSCAVWRRG